MRRSVARLLNAAGIAAPVLWVTAFVSVGSLRPDYNACRQYISELAARGTPTQHLMQVADPCCAPMAPSFSERMHKIAGATFVLTTGAAVLT